MAPAMSRPLRCSRTASAPLSSSVLVASTSPSATSGDRSDTTSAGLTGIMQVEPDDGAEHRSGGQHPGSEVGSGDHQRLGGRIIDEVERQPDDADDLGLAQLDGLEGLDRGEGVDRHSGADPQPVDVGAPLVDHDLVGVPGAG